VRIAAATLLALATLPGTAWADENAPCPADQPQPPVTLSEPGSGGILYATHVLRVRLGQPSSGSAEGRSFAASAGQVLPGDDENDALLVTDASGPVTVTAVALIRDDRLPSADDYSCTMTVSATFTLEPPAPTLFENFRRPQYTAPKLKLYSYAPKFYFRVRYAKTGGDQSPLTVRAAWTRKLRLPGARAKRVTKEYRLRDFEQEDDEGGRGCEFVCSPRARGGFAKSIEIRVDELGRGLEITVDVPTGYGVLRRGRYSFKPTPFGLDLEVLQSGRRVARLRTIARCDSGGQASRCRFRKIDTNL
jgi:hypothetical protein